MPIVGCISLASAGHSMEQTKFWITSLKLAIMFAMMLESVLRQCHKSTGSAVADRSCNESCH